MPGDNYDFGSDPGTIQLIKNAGENDINLLELVKRCHYEIMSVIEYPEQTIPIVVDGKTEYMDITLKSKKFNSVYEAIDYIKLVSRDNYFFLYSYLRGDMKFDIVSSSIVVRGLEDFRRDKILNMIV